MKKSDPRIITAIQNAARKLASSTVYQWGHMGACNCGYLAQEVTKLTREEIHKRAMVRHGDWSEQLNDYCPASGLPMDEMIFELLNFGFDINSLIHLERLSNSKILAILPSEEKNLRFNVKDDVVRYMKAWAALLEHELLENISLPAIETKEEYASV